MSTSSTRWRTTLGRIHARWPWLCGLMAVLALAWWLRPVRIERTIHDAATGETIEITAWDTSRLQAASAAGWQAFALLMTLVVLFSVAWSSRSWLLARASAARFFVASLLVHSLLMVSLWAVPLGRRVVHRAEVIRVAQAAQLFHEDPQPARGGAGGGQAAFEQVADLQAEKKALPALQRKPAAASPEASTVTNLLPTVPLQATRALPPERVLYVPSRQPEVRRTQEVPRQSAGHLRKPAEIDLDTVKPSPPEAAPREKPAEDRSVRQERQQPATAIPSGSEPLRLPRLKTPRPAALPPEVAEMPLADPTGPSSDPLAGRRQRRARAPARPVEPEVKLKAEATPESSPDAARGSLPRLAPPPPLPMETISKESRPALPPDRSLPGRLPHAVSEDMPRPEPVAERLVRRPARAAREAHIEEKVPAQANLLLRQKEVRQRSVDLFGGNAASEAAVERGLDWLAAHQSPDGHWSLSHFHASCKHPACSQAGTAVSDPAGTGIGLLPFLGAGHTHQGGKHQQTVARAIRWLVEQQRSDGSWLTPGDSRPMYGQGMAAIAVCEAYGMTQDPRLRGPAQKALDYIVRAQHQPTGGWRYLPNQPADTSVVGWQVMALKSGEMAGLSVPPAAFAGVKRWLASVEANRPAGGLFGYQHPNPTPAMTAQGLLCLQLLGTRRDDPRMRAGTDYLRNHLPQPQTDTSYYWYHATQVMYHVQGEHWKAWNGKLRDLLVSTQETQGGQAGSWKPVDHREKPGGRLYATALRLLMLEVYYRHLPLYQQLER